MQFGNWMHPSAFWVENCNLQGGLIEPQDTFLCCTLNPSALGLKWHDHRIPSKSWTGYLSFVSCPQSNVGCKQLLVVPFLFHASGISQPRCNTWEGEPEKDFLSRQTSFQKKCTVEPWFKVWEILQSAGRNQFGRRAYKYLFQLLHWIDFQLKLGKVKLISWSLKAYKSKYIILQNISRALP